MCLPMRVGRKAWKQPIDSTPASSYGDSILQKDPSTLRVFFQNVKGLSSSSGQEDYRYYFNSLQSLQVDVAGLSETNTCWQHPHLRDDLTSVARRYYRQSKIVFGSANQEIDPIPLKETFQAGGNLTFLNGSLVSRVSGKDIQDASGLGRWTGVTVQGKQKQYLTIITSYRVCSGSIRTAPLGSAFAREYHHFALTQQQSVNPRRLFLRDLQVIIQQLQEKGHSIILMMDANATETSDPGFSDFISACSLHDLHSADPAPSTYIGSESRRIDFIFGCSTVYHQTHRSGTLSYYEGPQSDHRSLFVDINMEFLQSQEDHPDKTSSARVLHTGNPELVQAYNASLLKYYTDHQMVERIDTLFENFRNMEKEAIRAELIRWDNDKGKAMEMSERRLSTPPKKCRWSPILRNLAKTRLYWKLRLREVEKQADYSATFQRWKQQIQVHDNSFEFPHMNDSLTASQIRIEFNKSSIAFRKCQKLAVPMRMKTYEALLEKYMDDSNPQTLSESKRKAQIVRNTIDGETIRNKFAAIRRIIRPSSNTSLSKVLIPRISDSDSSVTSDQTYRLLQETDPSDLLWETVIERDQLERHLLDYNRESFRAASESPCGHGLIYDSLTFSSLSPSAIKLLDGEIPAAWHEDDEALREFLASFTIPENIRKAGEIPTEITDDDVLYGFKKWRETTSTSPSGRHLGHYRSLIQHPTLLACFVKFLNIAVQSGISIPRWSNAVNVLIEKDPGTPKIHRLRIIHLFEADLNFFLKLQWGHRLVRRALDHDLLHDGQHGSIPRRTSIDPIMLTQLTTDLCRVLKHDFARFDNDASACYDRIIIALAMLAARKCGMPINAVKTHSDALFFMRYTVKTIHGISEDNYHGSEFSPLFGTGQGSGASPAAWLSLVVLLLQTLDRLVPDRINFASPLGDITHSRLADAFVDDTYLGFTSSDSASFPQLVDRLQDIAQKWEHLLHLSGGKLNLSKCSWYILRWEWEKGRPVLRKIKPTDPEISLRQGTSEVVHTIRRSEIDSSHRMLGVLLNPLGDFGAHLKSLKKKADTFAHRLMSPRLTSADVRIFHRSTYVPSMRYGLAAVAIDEEMLGTVQSRVVQAILKKLHVQSTIPTAIRHGPLEFGGLDIYDLRTEAGVEAIKLLRDSLYSDSETGKLLLLNLQYSQVEAGIGEPLLEHPDIYLSYLTPTWLLSVRQFLYCHNMTISVSNDYRIVLKGPKDQFIMQQQHLARYSASQQRDINLVRLYLQVHTLADMSDSRRKKSIDLSYLDAARPQGFVPHPSWPRQVAPTKAQSRLWKRFIRSSYLRYVPYWVDDPGVTTQHDQIVSAPPSPITYDTVFDYIQSQPRQHKRLLDGLQQISTDLQVWKAFRSRRRLHLASDGGLDSQKGTHGWILSTGTKTLFKCAGPVDGPRDTSSSTRSELAGYASALLLLRAMTRFWGLQHRCKFYWYCDSKAAISRVRRYASRCSRPSKMPTDADLISIIKLCQIELRFSLTPQWVKGHQDTCSASRNLSLASRLNIQADELATAYRITGRLKPSQISQQEEGQSCSISMRGIRLTSQYDSCIRFHINGYHLRGHMQEQNGWTNAQWEDIDFHVFGLHYRRLSSQRQATWMKFIHDQLPLGERRYRQAAIKEESLSLCPCCKHTKETMSHFLQCPINPIHTDGTKALRQDICGTDPHPACFMIYAGLHHYMSQSVENFDPCLDTYPEHLQDSIREALESQQSIGWEHATKGFLSQKWRQLASMAMYDTGLKNDQLGMSRMRRIITGIYDHQIRRWTSRNEALHSTTDEDLLRIRSVEAAEITQLFGQPSLLCSADRYLCSRPLDKLLSSAPSTKRRWLRRVKQSREKFHRDGTRQALITTFFRPSVSQTSYAS